MSQLSEINNEKNELEMTPMIDVTFLLLIFFMCTLKFKTLEGKLAAYLPKDVGVNTSESEPIEKVEILLQVVTEGNKLDPYGEPWAGEGRFVYDSTRVIQYSVGARKTNNLIEISKRIADLHKQDDERPATIDARPGIVYGDVVKVLDEAMSAGFTDITFVGAYDVQ
ncbi:MAG: biopolymer transport protein ExbD [Chlamydiales bacterium]|jgi:biopolymer transport protein ExbD